MPGAWVLVETREGIDRPIATGDVIAALERVGDVRRRFNKDLRLTHRVEPSTTAARSKIDHAPEE